MLRLIVMKVEDLVFTPKAQILVDAIIDAAKKSEVEVTFGICVGCSQLHVLYPVGGVMATTVVPQSLWSVRPTHH